MPIAAPLPLAELADGLRPMLQSEQPCLPGLAPADGVDLLTELAVNAAYALASRHWADNPARLLAWQGPISPYPMPHWVPGNTLGLVRARITSPRLWERDPEAEALACVPILPSLFSAPEDIAVFLPSAPGNVWYLRDQATAQNEAEITHGEGPLVLYPDLYAWARGGGDAAVIFDLDAWAPFLIERGRPIHCSTLELAGAVDKALRRARPKLPPIGVLSTGVKRAA